MYGEGKKLEAQHTVAYLVTVQLQYRSFGKVKNIPVGLVQFTDDRVWIFTLFNVYVQY
jgi:hypothetical protein